MTKGISKNTKKNISLKKELAISCNMYAGNKGGNTVAAGTAAKYATKKERAIVFIAQKVLEINSKRTTGISKNEYIIIITTIKYGLTLISANFATVDCARIQQKAVYIAPR